MESREGAGITELKNWYMGGGDSAYTGWRSKKLQEDRSMTLTVEATYEGGVLKLSNPLPLKDNQRVRVTVEDLDDPVGRTQGMFGWSGDAATIEYFALDPDLDPQESA
jgi:predicted DNA-binding antitoxin AbrB/MazE fold protein